MSEPVTPRETVILGPDRHTFETPDWCVRYRVTIKGAGAGSADGPGEDGYAIIEMYDQECDPPGC